MKFSVCAVDRDLPDTIPFPLRGKSYQECADIAKELGFDGIELQVQDPKFYNGKELKRMLDDRGLAASAITTGLAYTYEGMSMTHPDPAVRAATVERLKRQLDLAKDMDSQILVGFIRGRQLDRSAKEFEALLTDSVGQVLDYATEIQTPFIMEQVNHKDGDLFCSTERTMQFLEKFDSPWLVYNGDTYHMEMDDSDPVAAVKRSLSKLVLFHVSDVNRQLPDDKHFDFYEVAKVLKDVGYDKWTSIECKPLPNSYEACKNGIEYLKRVFR
ncbi:MAG: sugar phosphate isomerase/epimerase [Lachnospiraceae bacterium]|nr:sugar phosphate isomerase/epimerase [Candidatus Minthocola equi]